MLFPLVLLLLLQSPAIKGPSGPERPDSLLTEVAQKLNSVKSLQYESTRELNYPSENYHANSKWSVFCDFSSTDTLAGFRYQVEDSSVKEIYNGTEKFILDRRTMSMQVDDHPGKSNFQHQSFMYNSIITLRNILPSLINDATITKSVIDTLINNIHYTQITLNLGKRRIQNLGQGLDAMTTKYNFIYKILLTKPDHLPYEIIQMNDTDSDHITTKFTHFQSDLKAPDEQSWYFSTYADRR